MAKHKAEVVTVPQEDAPPVIDPLAPEKPVATKGPEMPVVQGEVVKAPKPAKKLWDVHYGKGGKVEAVPGYDESEAKAAIIKEKNLDPLKVGFVVLPHKA
jgi:hypothetical protein